MYFSCFKYFAVTSYLITSNNIPYHNLLQNPGISKHIHTASYPKLVEHGLSEKLQLVCLHKPQRLRANPNRRTCKATLGGDAKGREE